MSACVKAFAGTEETAKRAVSAMSVNLLSSDLLGRCPGRTGRFKTHVAAERVRVLRHARVQMLK